MTTMPSFLQPLTQTPTSPHAAASIERTWEVVTPMFLAGANQKAIAHEHLRAPSLKAQLRWWWRATVPGITAVADLHREEGRIFGDLLKGSGDKQTGHGQGVQVASKPVKGKWSTGDITLPHGAASLGYLLGQGLFHFRDGVTRPAVKPESQAIATISGKATGDLARAIEAFTLFGGLGSRSRRGWGSLAPLEDSRRCKDPAEYARRIATLLAGMPEQERGWSCLTKGTRVVVLPDTYASWSDALQAVGGPLHEFRASFGGQGPNGPARKPYGEDHDLVADSFRGIPLKRAPLRTAFGIPHNYFFKSSKKKVDFHWSESDRRASPLLLHVTRFAGGRYGVCALLMAGPFLPAGATISALRDARATGLKQPSLQIIHDFLTKLPAVKA